MKQSTKDKAAGKLENVKGKVKEKVGHMTKNPDLEDEGTMERVDGKTREVIGKIEKSAGH